MVMRLQALDMRQQATRWSRIPPVYIQWFRAFFIYENIKGCGSSELLTLTLLRTVAGLGNPHAIFDWCAFAVAR